MNGTDEIGYLSRSDCERISSAYDADKDLEFYFDRPPTWLTIRTGMFAVFYPHDAHAPLATEGPVHKVVVKVAVD